MHKVLFEILFQCTVYNGGIFLNKSAKCHLMAITKTNIFTKSHRNVSFLLHGLILQDFLVKFHFSAQCIMTAYLIKIRQIPLQCNYQVQCFHKTHMNLPLISLKYIFGEMKKSISLHYTVYNGGRFLKNPPNAIAWQYSHILF